MKVKIKPRKPGECGGTVCLPMVINVPIPTAKDWKKIKCPICGADCWESKLARQVIRDGAVATCTMCALKSGM